MAKHKDDGPAETLQALLDRRRELAATLQQAEHRQRVASSQRMDAEAAVTAAERRRLTGDGSEEAVAAAEERLAEARRSDQEPWALRASGAKAAVRDVEREIGEFAATSYAALAAGVNEEAEQAAAAVNEALAQLQQAIAAREEVSGRAHTLWARVARPQPGLVAASRCEKIARDAEALLMAGGERAPVLPPTYLPPDAEMQIPEVDSEAVPSGAEAPADAVGRPRVAR